MIAATRSLLLAAVLLTLTASTTLGGSTGEEASTSQGWEVARHLPRGARLQVGDVRPVRIAAKQVSRSLTGTEQSLIGMRTRRSLVPGTLLRPQYVERPPLVDRGDAVTLRIQRGALRIEARGKAKERGNAGDSVRVVNVDSQKIVTGRVARDGSVIVSF